LSTILRIRGGNYEYYGTTGRNLKYREGAVVVNLFEGVLALWDEYREQIKSDIADIKNIGGPPAGAITTGIFFSEFTADYPWVHLDVAGTVLPAKTGPYIPKGPGGIGVRLLTQFARNWRKKP